MESPHTPQPPPWTEAAIYAIERPHPRLLTLYILRSILSGPLIFIVLPALVCRYVTLRYRFDAEGIHARWGVFFQRQVNLTYARIQDIHLSNGVIQRWLGLADLKIQTASGSAGAEMTIEGLMEYEAIRDFLYTRMRGYREHAAARAASQAPVAASATAGLSDPRVVELLHGVIEELRATRLALEALRHPETPPEPRHD